MVRDRPPARYQAPDVPPFAVNVDLVVLTLREGVFSVAVVERGVAPHKGKLALPGGFVRLDEDLAQAAQRELAEETGLTAGAAQLEQLGAYGAPRRDPRMRVVTVAFLALAPELPELRAGTDAAGARFLPVADALADPRRLAFDHHRILGDGVERARRLLEETPAAMAFCTPPFTLAVLRKVYEAVWGVGRLDAANFRRKVLSIPGFVVEEGAHATPGRGRPAALYRPGPATALRPALLGPARFARPSSRR